MKSIYQCLTLLGMMALAMIGPRAIADNPRPIVAPTPMPQPLPPPTYQPNPTPPVESLPMRPQQPNTPSGPNTCIAQGSPGSSSVDLRQAPGSSQNLGSVPNGATVTVQNYSLDRLWALVSGFNSAGQPINGWAYLLYLQCGNTNNRSLVGSGQYPCRLQGSPGVTFVVARNIPNGQETVRFKNGHLVQVRNWSDNGNWAYVFAPNGKQGWVWSNYVQCPK